MRAGDRWISFSTVFNFRDLGGYLGCGGREVRWGQLYRSDSLVGLTFPTDWETFTALGVRTVIDLRSQSEIEKSPPPAVAGLTYASFRPASRRTAGDLNDPRADVARIYANRYLSMAVDTLAEVGGALRMLSDPARRPLVFYCHGGRDRTGVLAAIVLALLGVDDGQIASDYTLSAIAETRYNLWLLRNRPGEPLPPPAQVATPSGAILLFLASLRQRFGSVEAYVRAAGVSGCSIESLRAHMLAGTAAGGCPRTG